MEEAEGLAGTDHPAALSTAE
ncbi:arginyl-tRNA synthetase [Synechococcus sp. WH 7805]|nr:arginyl-tRNA synthetase [Synechococcus sp. WH 7805]